MNSYLAVFIALGAPVLFALWWMLIVWLIAYFGGWMRLAAVYPAPEIFEESRQWHFQSAVLGRATRYRGCLTVGAGMRGLYLRPWWLFRFRHPPLLIPWPQIEGRSVSGLFYKDVELKFSRCPVIMRISQALADQLETAAHGTWKYIRM